MSEAKFTPGPWYTSGVRINRGGQPFLQVIGPKGSVALVPYSDLRMTDHVEAHADARLIAAAPDLLEALVEERRIRLLGQEPKVHWESLRDVRRACYEATDAAIAKAIGAAS